MSTLSNHSSRSTIHPVVSSRFNRALNHHWNRQNIRLALASQVNSTLGLSSGSSLAHFSSESITYSGGQATEGQGGYYGSGGSRKLNITYDDKANNPRSTLLALAADVTNITNTMEEVENLEQLLLLENKQSEITGKIIEIKSKIKKACTNPEFLDSLNRLELNGEPIWGLSGEEREMIMSARAKVNEC
jgi:hypothetical protein